MTPRVILLSLLALLTAPAAAQEKAPEKAQARKFQPERCFPLECLAYLHVSSGADLVALLGETTLGRIARDPEVRAALGNLPSMLRDMVRAECTDLIEVIGKDPFELLDFLSGEIAVSITGIDPVAKLGIVASVELGPRRGDLLKTLGRLEKWIGEQGNTLVDKMEVAGRKATVLQVAGSPPLAYVVLGDHLVLSTSRDVLTAVGEAYQAKEPDAALASNDRYREADGALALERRRVLAFLNVEAIRGLLMTFALMSPEMQDVVKTAQAAGIMSITTLGLSMGSTPSGPEAKLLLGSGNGLRGLLGDVLLSFGPAREPGAALERMGPRVKSAGAASFDGGRLFQGVRRFLNEGLPEAARPQVQEVVKKLEEKTGLSLEKDLGRLPRLDLHVLGVEPQAGGLPDGLLFVRTDAFGPYRAVLEKVMKALGEEPRRLAGPAGAGGTGAPAIVFYRAGSVFTRLLEIEPPPPPEGLALALAQPPISLAVADLEGGWTVASNAPQPLWRHLLGSQTGEKGAPQSIRAGFAAAGEGKLFSVAAPDTSVLALYNTVSVLGMVIVPFLDSFLAPAGLDLARLPPGEKFLPEPALYFTCDTGEKGLLIHSRPLPAAPGTSGRPAKR